MAWLYKRGGVWWIGWRHDGKQFLQTTEHTEKPEAEKTLARFEELQRQKRNGTLTDEYYALLTGKTIQRPTLELHLQGWLKESSAAELTPRTVTKYQQIVREFLDHTEARKTGMLLADVTPDHVRNFLNWKSAQSSSATAAGFRRVLRSIFIQAAEEKKITGNPVQSANRRKNRQQQTTESKRKRAFTIDEVKTLHARADAFWQWMIRVAFFTGMALGDAVTLTRRHVDLALAQIAYVRRKTGKSIRVPMHPELAEMFREFPGKPDDYYWPEQAERYLITGASSLSQEFFELMASAGIVPPRDSKKLAGGKGRSARREQTPIGFHNLRHTFISLLKIQGANEATAKELVGHRSDLISTHYTHMPESTLSDAVNKLPGVGK